MGGDIMTYEVDVVEIKTKKIAFRHTAEEMNFIEHYSPSNKLATDDGEFLTGPAASNEVQHQQRRAMRIRSSEGNDKFIIWSPEFEKFVGQELSWLNDARDELNDARDELNKAKDELDTANERVKLMRKTNAKNFIFGMVGTITGIISVANWWLNC